MNTNTFGSDCFHVIAVWCSRKLTRGEWLQMDLPCSTLHSVPDNKVPVPTNIYPNLICARQFHLCLLTCSSIKLCDRFNIVTILQLGKLRTERRVFLFSNFCIWCWWFVDKTPPFLSPLRDDVQYCFVCQPEDTHTKQDCVRPREHSFKLETLAQVAGKCLKSCPEGSLFFGRTAWRSKGHHWCGQMVKAEQRQLQGQHESLFFPFSLQLAHPAISYS